eukprot:TRINITY_DN23043_c0_g2_i1.p1 TRINITY_DN23043_c0_g2~~TRINITY_DN23043_c0_g2_i1.p1  ORF type:complete len:1442 (+),score=226.71 TRINITY_DN23043_c0_g2_i1:32-4327(+)
MDKRLPTDAITRLFTFGCGALGELGWDRREDAGCRPEATAVVFPSSVWRHGPEDQADVQSVALGNDHSLAVADGYVFRWGLLCAPVGKRCSNAGGSLGADGAGGYSRSGKQNTVAETAGGCHHHLGGVVPTPTPMACWCSSFTGESIAGGDASGGGGGGSQPSSEGLDGNVRAVAAGGSNSFMLTSGGEVFLFGQLRPFSSADAGHIRHLWGSHCSGPASRVMQVAAGWRHVLLLTEAGCVFALGDDEHGQCAGCSSGQAALPFQTSQRDIAGVAAGASHCVAWDRKGAAFTWGHGGAGRLGLGGTKHQKTPACVETLSELKVVLARCGANFTVFVTSMVRGGSQHHRPEVGIWACGGNQYGQCACLKTQIYVPTSIAFPFEGRCLFGTHGISAVEGLECGANHVLCLARPPGVGQDRLVVWAWGSSAFGQCGRAADEDLAKPPERVRWTPKPLIDFLLPSQHWPIGVAAGRAHSAVLARVKRKPVTVDLAAASGDQQAGKLEVNPAPELSNFAQDVWDALADAMQLPTATSCSNSMPSLHAGKQQQQQQLMALPQCTAAVCGKGRRLGRRLQASNICSPKVKHCIGNEDSVINQFCDLLLSPEPREPQRVHRASVASPSVAAFPSSQVQWLKAPKTLTRTPSQVELLLQLGEAELHGAPQKFGNTRRVDERARQPLQVRPPLEAQLRVQRRADFALDRDESMHMRPDAGRSLSWRKPWTTRSSSTPSMSSRRLGRGQVGQRVSQTASWQRSWPPMPPSWSCEMMSPSRNFAPQDQHYDSARVQLVPNSSDEESFVPPPRRPMVRPANISAQHVEYPAAAASRSTSEDCWNHVHTVLEDLASVIASTKPTQLPPPVAPAWRSTCDDRWKGVHRSLDDLGSMIANIGSSKKDGPPSPPLRSRLPEGDFAAGMDRGIVCGELLETGQACDNFSISCREEHHGAGMVVQDRACLPSTPSQAARVKGSVPIEEGSAGTREGHGRWQSPAHTCNVETQTILSGSEAFGNVSFSQAEPPQERGHREQTGKEHVITESVDTSNRTGIASNSPEDKRTHQRAATAPTRCSDDHKSKSSIANQSVLAIMSSTTVGTTANDINGSHLTQSKHKSVHSEQSHTMFELGSVQDHYNQLCDNRHDADKRSNSPMSPGFVRASAPNPSMSMSPSPSPIPRKGNDESMASALQPFALDDSVSSSGDEHTGKQAHTSARNLHGELNDNSRSSSSNVTQRARRVTSSTDIGQMALAKRTKHKHAEHADSSLSVRGSGSVSDGSSHVDRTWQDTDKPAGSPTSPNSLQAYSNNQSAPRSPSPSPTPRKLHSGSVHSQVKPFSLDEAGSSSEDEDNLRAAAPVKTTTAPLRAMRRAETTSVDDSDSDGSTLRHADSGVSRRSPVSSAAATPNHASGGQCGGPRASGGSDSISEIEVASVQSFGGSSSDSD